jgi:hypothetical protein
VPVEGINFLPSKEGAAKINVLVIILNVTVWSRIDKSEAY